MSMMTGLSAELEWGLARRGLWRTQATESPVAAVRGGLGAFFSECRLEEEKSKPPGSIAPRQQEQKSTMMERNHPCKIEGMNK